MRGENEEMRPKIKITLVDKKRGMFLPQGGTKREIPLIMTLSGAGFVPWQCMLPFPIFTFSAMAEVRQRLKMEK